MKAKNLLSVVLAFIFIAGLVACSTSQKDLIGCWERVDRTLKIEAKKQDIADAAVENFKSLFQDIWEDKYKYVICFKEDGTFESSSNGELITGGKGIGTYTFENGELKVTYESGDDYKVKIEINGDTLKMAEVEEGKTKFVELIFENYGVENIEEVGVDKVTLTNKYKKVK